MMNSPFLLAFCFFFSLCCFSGCNRLPQETSTPESEAELKQRTQEILLNIYQVNQLDQPGKIYDSLAQSFAGTLLEHQFFQQLQGKKVLEENNTTLGDMHIGFTYFKRLEIRPFARLVELGWEVRGDIWHLLHQHTRHNRYQAQLVLTRLDQNWKITDIHIQMELRVE
ncbi:MAG: hypothetical protein AABZ60_03235 [Planctomycetota bacterium]